MPFDWKEYLTLAQFLSGRADEASKRSAISRAYYSVFNPAFARAELTSGAFPGGETSHMWCWNKYGSTPHPSCRKLAADGQRMERRRDRADYRQEIPRSDHEVRLVIEEAIQ